MPRKQVGDLQEVKLGGAARQVNTFVAAPRAARTNGALELSKALSGIQNILVEKQELDVKQATDRKLYGGSVFTDTSRERLAEYETSKGELRSMEEAEAYFLEVTKQDFEDPHAAAGYEEKRQKELSLFRGKHAEYLAGVAVAERSDHVFKDYLSTVMTDGVEAAEARKNSVTSNYGMSPKDLNQMTINAAGTLIARGDLDQAEAILQHKRGAAGTLLENPDTTKEAAILHKKLKTARKDKKDAQVEAFKAQRETSELNREKNQVEFTDNILDSKELSYEEKITELNKMDVLGEVNDGYATEVRRYLKSQNDIDVENNGEVMSGLIERVYDVNQLADRDPKNYLRGINEIQQDIMKMRSKKELTKREEDTLKKQIKTLTSPKIAKAATRLNRSFKDSKKMFENNLPVSFQGEAIRELFYSTDMEEFQEELEGKDKKEVKALYKQKAVEVLETINKRRRDVALQKVQDGLQDEDTEFLQSTGIDLERFRKDAAEAGLTERDAIKLIRDKVNSTEVPGETKPTSSEGDQILKDEGVVKNDNGDHISYLDSRGFVTGGHGHLLTEEEKKLYPKGTPIPQEVVDRWKDTDLKEAEQDVAAIFGEVKHPEVQKVLKNMAFNLGRTKLNKFTRLKEAIRNEDYKLAAAAMRNSLWYKQVGNRSKRLVDRIESLA